MADLIYINGSGYHLNTDGTTAKISLGQKDNVSISVVISGAVGLAGTMRVRESNTLDNSDPGDLVSFDNGTAIVTGYDVTGNGRFSFELTNTASGHIQLDWLFSSGDGYMEYYAVTKRS